MRLRYGTCRMGMVCRMDTVCRLYVMDVLYIMYMMPPTGPGGDRDRESRVTSHTP